MEFFCGLKVKKIKKRKLKEWTSSKANIENKAFPKPYKSNNFQNQISKSTK